MKVQHLVWIVFVFSVVVLGGLVVILRNQLQAKEFELATAHETIKSQADSIARITAQRKIDDRIVTEFTKGLAEIKATGEAQTLALSELEKTDPSVKEYFSIPLPTSLGELFRNGQNHLPDDGTKPAR